RESLTTQWRGFVWMNPPFGGRNGLLPWLAKWDSHGDGIALVPDRTSAPWWQIYAGRAQLLLFVAPKLKLFRGAPRPDMADLFGSVPSDGSLEPGASPAQGTTLLGIGEQACAALWNASARGLGLLSKPARRSGD
ncbi:MAG TPA: hypothetical protein VMU93_06570, partial [Caulobacteraceae bacterium]|nr:hypothetical protein [Caulobacteraceae bacterium]